MLIRFIFLMTGKPPSRSIIPDMNVSCNINIDLQTTKEEYIWLP